MFGKLYLSVPAPFFVTVLEPFAIGVVVHVISPAPSKISGNVPVTPPASVSVPASEAISVPPAELSVITPLNVLVPLMFRSAPFDETPYPRSASGSYPTEIFPCSSSAAPPTTSVPSATLPSAVLFCAFITPTLIFVVPPYVLAPESKRVPKPSLLIPPTPAILPEIVRVSAAFVTTMSRVTSKRISSAIVLPPEEALSVRPARPGPKMIGFPESVYPLPEIVIELKIVFSVKSFVLERFDAPAGNTRSSPDTGAVPPQLLATDHKPFVVPVHVLVAASALPMYIKKKKTAKNAREIFKRLIENLFIFIINTTTFKLYNIVYYIYVASGRFLREFEFILMLKK